MNNVTEDHVFVLTVRDPQGDMSMPAKVFKTYPAAKGFITDVLDIAYQGHNIATSETVGYTYHVTVYNTEAVKVADFSIKKMQVFGA